MAASSENASGPARSTKRVTLQALADSLGLHKSTVSLVLSGKGTLSAATRARVLAAAREMGFRPHPLAQRLARGVSGNLVCILSGGLDVGLGTAKALLIQERLAAESLEVPVYTFARSSLEAGEAQAIQVGQICSQRPRAILCAGALFHPRVFAELEAYQREGGIVVSYDMPIPLACDQVIFDREDNAYQAARYLLERGHRAIGIGMSRYPAWAEGAPYLPQTHRLRGFRRALAEFGLPLREEWVFLNGTYELGGEEMARRFLALRERPTAVTIVNDYVALAFMSEIVRAGLRVPEDVSIVSHDNQRVALHCPVPLTAVTHPVDAIVRTTVELVRERMAGSTAPPQRVVVRGDLVERQSVAPPATR